MTQLLLSAALTAAVETMFLAAAYRRDAAFLGLYAAVNVASNLTLNLLLALLPRAALTWLVYPLELAVAAADYSVYALACGRSRRLFLLTLAANVLSYSLGLLIFGHV